MKKKAIESIPYLGLKKVSRKKDVKYIGVTTVKIIGHEKHLFLEVYRNKKESEETPLVRIVLTKKDFGNYFPEKEKWTRQQVDGGDVYYGGELIWSDRQDHSVSWMELQNRNILQDAADQDRIKKFCNAPYHYNEKKWWGYIAAHEQDIVSTARRKTEPGETKKGFGRQDRTYRSASGKRSSGYGRQPLLSERTLPVLQKAWRPGEGGMQ